MNRTNPSNTFDSLPDVALIQLRPLLNFKVVPYSATTIWRKCRYGEFPAPIKVSKGITAWRVGDIRKYLSDIGNQKIHAINNLRKSTSYIRRSDA